MNGIKVGNIGSKVFGMLMSTFFLFNLQEKAIVFALSQTAYGASMLAGYWGYFLLYRMYKVSDLFPFRFVFLFLLEFLLKKSRK